MKPKLTRIYTTAKIQHICYQCPHCEQVVNYDTDGLPKAECHWCLKPLKWNVDLEIEM